MAPSAEAEASEGIYHRFGLPPLGCIRRRRGPSITAGSGSPTHPSPSAELHPQTPLTRPLLSEGNARRASRRLLRQHDLATCKHPFRPELTEFRRQSCSLDKSQVLSQIKHWPLAPAAFSHLFSPSRASSSLWGLTLRSANSSASSCYCCQISYIHYLKHHSCCTPRPEVTSN